MIDHRSPPLTDKAAITARFDALWMKRLDRILPVPTLVLGGVITWYGASPLGCIAAIIAYILANVLLSQAALRWGGLEPDGPARMLASMIPLAGLVYAAGPEGHGWILASLPAAVVVFARGRLGAARSAGLFIATVVLASWWVGASIQTLVVATVVLASITWVTVGLYETMLSVWIRAEERGEALQQTNEALEDALEARQRFLATMSHEVRTPMNGVVGTAELLGHTELDEEQRRLLRVVRQSSLDLLRVLDDILDTARLDAGALELESIPYSPRQLATGVLDLLRPTVRHKDVELVSDIDGLPDAVCGDPTRLRQVLLNLVGNATKFTEHGRVTVCMRWADGRLSVEVRDTGIGIPEEAQADLFDPFVQAERGTSRKFGGTGLGLTISHRLVTLMGGSLELDSAVDVGSCFGFTIDAPRAASSEVTPTDEDAPALPPLHVLVVDDSPVNLMVARRMLERLGCTVHTASDGSEVSGALDAYPFDVVLMDCRMVDVDGFEATQALRAAGHTLPVLALTAGVTEAEVQRCMDVGMNGVVSKPVSMDDLSASLRAHAAQAGAAARA